MRTTLPLVAAVVLLGSLAPRAVLADEAQPTPPADEFRADVLRLMDLTGAGDIGVQVIEQMVAMLRQSHTGVPDAFWDEFVASVDAEELVEQVVPIYEKHFTHEDVKGLIAFYSSPLGQKVLSAQPKIVEESMLAGQLWGAQVGQQVDEKLREEGYR